MPFRDAWLVVGGLLIVLGFGAAEPVVSGVGMVILVIGGVARVWSNALFRRLSFRTHLSERRAFAGEQIDLDIELENRKPLPLPWYRWRLALADPVRVEKETLSASAAPGLSWIVRHGALGWYERHHWHFRISALERGYHQVGPATVRSADIFGLFPRVMEEPEVKRLTVFPQVYRFEEMGLPSDRPLGQRKGRDRLFEDPIRIAGLRDYRPGDALRRIDWKATARRGELQSRVYEPSAEQQLYLMVNIDTLEHSWEGYLKDDLERTISTAASVAVWAGAQRYAIGLLANGSFPDADRPIRLAPSRSRDQVTRILEALAVIQPLTMGDLAGSIRRESGRIPAGSTVILVASLIPEPLAAVVSRLRDEGNEVVVFATSSRVDTSLLRNIPVHATGLAFSPAPAGTP
jgi:uncharacterized protein (DUF58 family)